VSGDYAVRPKADPEVHSIIPDRDDAFTQPNNPELPVSKVQIPQEPKVRSINPLTLVPYSA